MKEAFFRSGLWIRRFFEMGCERGVFPISSWIVNETFFELDYEKKKNHVFKDITTIIIIVI